MPRNKNPWIGRIGETKESMIFGGYRHYYQISWFDGKKQTTKKFYFDPGNESSKTQAYSRACAFRNAKTIELKGVSNEQ